jgi:anti-sigma B factor antagonist
MSEAISPPLILKTVDGITIVTFTGPKVGTEAREELFRLMETQGNRKLILNFENVRSLSSAPIGMLVNLMNKAASAGGAVRLCQLDPNVQEILRLTRVEGLFSIFANEQDARDSFLSR